jgi:hypothetical protein
VLGEMTPRKATCIAEDLVGRIRAKSRLEDVAEAELHEAIVLEARRVPKVGSTQLNVAEQVPP